MTEIFSPVYDFLANIPSAHRTLLITKPITEPSKASAFVPRQRSLVKQEFLGNFPGNSEPPQKVRGIELPVFHGKQAQ